MSVLEQIAQVFDSAGIPRHVWEPIARQESGLSATAWNRSGEDSRGIFQINLDAHPEYAGFDLFDPVVNAQIAARDFIGPAYEQVRWNPDPGAQAAYVWQYGIRPNWTSVQASGRDVVLMDQARRIAGGDTLSPDNTDGGQAVSGGGGGPLTREFWIGAGLQVFYVTALLLLAIAGVWSLGRAFGVDATGIAGKTARAALPV